ncbi:MAG: hypothetical protein CVU98_11440 [Firmicutes bacterium HGW-Firmicutes-3]|jgi:hypothetical protein|nr:MAG: hypothetical protein CVU98_11440 [Firmicutes bacterium HGW-Firmicutes-3]
MSTFKKLINFFFGDWQEAYITTLENEFNRVIGLLDQNDIKYKYKILTGHKNDRTPTSRNAYYVHILKEDFPKFNQLLDFKY